MKHALFPVTLAGVLLLGGCSDPATQLELKGGVAVSFATRSPALAPGFSPSRTYALLDDTLIAGSDTLIVTQARLVLRDIELKPAESATCDDSVGSDCEEIELGPVLVELPLVAGAEQQFAIEVPAGSYSEIDFEIHKVGDDPDDLAFLAQHPGFEDISIRVDGTFNGTPFTFTTDVNEEQELALVPALVVGDSTTTNVTIFVRIDSWFRAADGSLIDPATANVGGVNKSLVDGNIKESLDAFEDGDGDGRED
jgi:hypothetical protein